MRVFNRTITQIAIAQGAAGSTDLVAAPGAGLRIFVVQFKIVLDAAGSLKFQENAATDLTGAMPVSLNGEVSSYAPGSDMPVLETLTSGLKLNIVTVTGKAFGWLKYFVAPST